MNSIKHRFTLDMHSTQSQISIPALVGDTGRSLHINFSDGGNPYFIETGCLAKISIMRPTGTRIEEFCEIVDNSTAVYHFAQNENTCAVEGIHDCDVTLYGLDGECIASPRFSMVVSERVIRSDDINVTDEDRSMVEAMVTAEVQRQAAETLRTDAESERVAAEDVRREAEAERQANYNKNIPIRPGISEGSLAVKDSVSGVKGYYIREFTAVSRDDVDGYIYIISLTLSKDGALSNSTGGISVSDLNWKVGDRVSIVDYNMFDNAGYIDWIGENNDGIAEITIIITSETAKRHMSADNGYIHNDQDKSIVNIDNPEAGIIDFGLHTVALGDGNKALLSYSFVHGINNEGIGKYSATFGRDNLASYGDFVAGRNNKSTAEFTDVFGQNNVVGGNGASVHGKGHTVTGEASASFGINNKVSGRGSAALGIGLQASGDSQAVVGKYNASDMQARFIVGGGTGSAERKNLLVVDDVKSTFDTDVHIASNITNNTAKASGLGSVSFGRADSDDNTVTGENAFSAGVNNVNHCKAAATFGTRSHATRDNQLVCGRDNVPDGRMYFIVGNGTASYEQANAFTVREDGAIAGGVNVDAGGNYSVAFNRNTTASANQAFAEGYNTVASASCAHSAGRDTEASGINSYAGGRGTKAIADSQFAIGKYNSTGSSNFHFIVGNGTSDTARSNAFAVATSANGEAYIVIGKTAFTEAQLKKLLDLI